MTVPEKRRPNFLIILADDLAWSDLGCFGGEISTPSIDALGYDGLRLTDFHASALCSPTRAMLLTGTDHHLTGFGQLAEFVRISPSHLGKPGYEGYLTENTVTFPQLLQDAGYFTTMAGKWHLGSEKEHSPLHKGFQRSFAMLNGCCNHFAWEPPVEKKSDVPPFFSTNTAAYHREDGEIVTSLPADFYSSDYYAKKMVEYLEEHRQEAPEQPFFAYLPFTAAHWPIQAPKENCDHYLGRYDEGPHALHRERLAKQKELGLTSKTVVPHPMVAPEVPAWDDMTPDAKARSVRTMEAYAGMVERMDYNVGKVVEYLKQSGQYDDTYIIFMSDNGAEGAAIEAGPTMQGNTLAHMQQYYDNSLDNIGRATSYCWYGPLWAQAGTAPSRLHKWFSTEGGIRVPFIISKEDLPRPSGIETAFGTVMDLAPTILELAGAKSHAGEYRGRKVATIRGKSWAEWLGHPSQNDIHEPEYEVGWELMGSAAYRKGLWKVNWVHPPKGPGKWQLYDLSADPGETADLAEEFPEKLEQLVSLWKTYAKDVGVAGLKSEIEPFRQMKVEENLDHGPSSTASAAHKEVPSRQVDSSGPLLPVVSQDVSTSSTIETDKVAAAMPMTALPRTPDDLPPNGSPYPRSGSHQYGEHPGNPRQTSWRMYQEKGSPTQPESGEGVDDNVPNSQQRSTMGTEGIVEGGSGTVNGSSVYLGHSSAAAFIHEIRVHSPKRPRETGSTASPHTERDHPVATSLASGSSRRRHVYDQEMTSFMQQVVLPPRQFADARLQNYWTYFYPFNPLLHRKTFEKRYEAIWSSSISTDGSRASPNDEGNGVDYMRAIYALVNIMIALGSLYADASNKSPSSEQSVTSTSYIFYERAESLITRKSMDHSNLLSVQVFILMAQYLQTTGLVNKCWITVGTAIRIAQGFGIHLDRTSESQAQQQERRRTWAYCIQMDRTLAMIFGRPPMVTWPSKDLPPDLTDDDLLSSEAYSCNEPIPKVERSVLGFFVHSVRFSEIMLEVLRILYTHPPAQGKEHNVTQFLIDDYHQLFALDAALAQWRSQLPHSLILRPEDDLSGDSISLSQGIAMLCRLILDVFTASTALLAVLLSPDVQSLLPSTIGPLETTWKRAIDVLVLYEEQGCKFAGQCAMTLRTALSQGLRDLRSHSRGKSIFSSMIQDHTTNLSEELSVY
ncbi:arylsulfatase [Paramyrothecium foliicola]|nr:arylsulfatase [Paramyrothecium foliicola]